MESEYSNVVSWISSLDKGPWKLHFILMEIDFRIYLFQISFNHVWWTAVVWQISLPNSGVNRVVPLLAHIL